MAEAGSAHTVVLNDRLAVLATDPKRMSIWFGVELSDVEPLVPTNAEPRCPPHCKGHTCPAHAAADAQRGRGTQSACHSMSCRGIQSCRVVECLAHGQAPVETRSRAWPQQPRRCGDDDDDEGEGPPVPALPCWTRFAAAALFGTFSAMSLRFTPTGPVRTRPNPDRTGPNLFGPTPLIALHSHHCTDMYSLTAYLHQSLSCRTPSRNPATARTHPSTHRRHPPRIQLLSGRSTSHAGSTRGP